MSTGPELWLPPSDLYPLMDATNRVIADLAKGLRSRLDRLPADPASQMSPSERGIHRSWLDIGARKYLRIAAAPEELADGDGQAHVTANGHDHYVSHAYTSATNWYVSLCKYPPRVISSARSHERWVGLIARGAADDSAVWCGISDRGNVSGEKTDLASWGSALERSRQESGLEPRQRVWLARRFMRGVAEADLVASGLRQLHGLDSDCRPLQPLYDQWKSVRLDASHNRPSQTGQDQRPMDAEISSAVA